MKLLHIDSSITGANSISRQISAEVVAAWRAKDPTLQVTYRDLEREKLPHLDSRLLGAAFAGWTSDDASIAPEVATSAAMLQEFLDADVVVIGAPMYNFAISSQLKAWIDRLLIGGKTFRYTEAGPVGLAGGKKVIIVSSRGGLYTPGMPNEALDFQERYLRAALGFIGIDDVEVVRAEGVAVGPEQREGPESGAGPRSAHRGRAVLHSGRLIERESRSRPREPAGTSPSPAGRTFFNNPKPRRDPCDCPKCSAKSRSGLSAYRPRRLRPRRRR